MKLFQSLFILKVHQNLFFFLGEIHRVLLGSLQYFQAGSTLVV